MRDEVEPTETRRDTRQGDAGEGDAGGERKAGME